VCDHTCMGELFYYLLLQGRHGDAHGMEWMDGRSSKRLNTNENNSRINNLIVNAKAWVSLAFGSVPVRVLAFFFWPGGMLLRAADASHPGLWLKSRVDRHIHLARGIGDWPECTLQVVKRRAQL